MKKRIISLLLSVSMLMASLSACAPASSPEEKAPASEDADNSQTAANEDAPAENTSDVSAEEDAAASEMDTSPITISVLNRVNAEIIFDDNPMLKAVEEKTGVTLEIEAPPISNYTDRLQLTMASGELPDLIYTWDFDQKYEKWANDGLILPLDEYIGNYPNLMANLNESQFNMARVGGSDGQLYAIPRAHTEATWGVIANQEWLDKLGVSMPTTQEEI